MPNLAISGVQYLPPAPFLKEVLIVPCVPERSSICRRYASTTILCQRRCFSRLLFFGGAELGESFSEMDWICVWDVEPGTCHIGFAALKFQVISHGKCDQVSSSENDFTIRHGIEAWGFDLGLRDRQGKALGCTARLILFLDWKVTWKSPQKSQHDHRFSDLYWFSRLVQVFVACGVAEVTIQPSGNQRGVMKWPGSSVWMQMKKTYERTCQEKLKVVGKILLGGQGWQQIGGPFPNSKIPHFFVGCSASWRPSSDPSGALIATLRGSMRMSRPFAQPSCLDAVCTSWIILDRWAASTKNIGQVDLHQFQDQWWWGASGPLMWETHIYIYIYVHIYIYTYIHAYIQNMCMYVCM